MDAASSPATGRAGIEGIDWDSDGSLKGPGIGRW